MKKTALVIMAAGIGRNWKPFWKRNQAACTGRPEGRDHYGLFHP